MGVGTYPGEDVIKTRTDTLERNWLPRSHLRRVLLQTLRDHVF